MRWRRGTGWPGRAHRAGRRRSARGRTHARSVSSWAFAVGLPILCGFTLAQEPARRLPRGRLTIVLGVAFVVAHFLAFWQNLRRYAVGIKGPLLFWWDADWSPPMPSLLLLVGYAALLVALAVWLWGGKPDAETADAEITTTASTRQVPGLE